MYILFETWRDDVETIYNYDAVGYADTEGEAYTWCKENAEYRTYKYCPDKKISYH